MLLSDVNILVHAHRQECPSHAAAASFLTILAEGDAPFALSEPALQGFCRIVTNPRIFRPASTLKDVFRFIDALTSRPHAVLLRPGPRHWDIFRQLCERSAASGKLVADAAHAALAIESGCEWVTTDSDFARFQPTLRWRLLPPLEHPRARR
jgi:toxin-antitoxin system PIN domain toxin